MRLFYYLSFTLLLAVASNAQKAQLLAPQQMAPLYAHLHAINHEWLQYPPTAELLVETQFSSDIERIQRHLKLTTQHLRQHPPLGLTAAQLYQRNMLLDELNRYQETARFPINRMSLQPTPIFVDDAYTACAVGDLLLATGETALVEDIRQHNNFAQLAELLAYPKLSRWAEQNGFTAEELALIQPSYAVVYFTPEPIGNNLGITAGRKISDMVTYKDEVYFAGNFSQIDGLEAASVAAWDGERFRALAGLLPGVGGIKKLAFDEATDDLYAIGTFFNFQDEPGPVLFARYRNGAWEPLLNTTDVSGLVFFRDLVCHNGFCYLGGRVSELFEEEVDHLIVYDIANERWKRFNDELRFTDVINDMAISGDTLMVGGRFALVNETDTISNFVALFDLNANQLILLADPLSTEPFKSVILVNIQQSWNHEWEVSAIFDNEGDYSIGVYQSSNYWETTPLFFDENNPRFEGMEAGFFYGDFQFTNWSQSDQPFVLVTVPGQSADFYWPIVRANGAVTALTYFNDEIILAGEFTEIDGVGCQQMARASLLISDTENPAVTSQVSVQSDGQSIFIQHLPTTITSATLELFDLQGKRVWQQSLSGSGSIIVLNKPSQLIAGAYAYRLLANEQLKVGQLILLSTE